MAAWFIVFLIIIIIISFSLQIRPHHHSLHRIPNAPPPSSTASPPLSTAPHGASVLRALLRRLDSDSKFNNSVKLIDEARICEIERVQRRYLVNFDRFGVLNFWPTVTSVLFYKRWEELLVIRKEQEYVFIPLIRARKEEDEDSSVSYVDTLLNRKLNEGEMVTLFSEFLNAGSDATATALEWIMANLVKYQEIQRKVVEEIREVMGDREDSKEVKEKDLRKMRYVKAVVLEGLRRHPPAHFVLPHAGVGGCGF